MPCYRPLHAYQHKTKKGPPLFSLPRGFSLRNPGPYQPLDLPCGQCIGCRLERSRIWAARLMFENEQHERSSFITVTYNDENLPETRSLELKAPTDFIRRLRKYNGHDKLRYFYAGEYGSLNDRPHYHFCVFGLDFPDKELHSTRLDIPLYRSASLESLWPYGFSTIGALSFESCAYVARYVVDKITGDRAKEHYQGRKPEFCNMSRRPGIARQWYETYRRDIYNYDKLVIRDNIVCRPPRYFDKLFESEYPDSFEQLKISRSSKQSSESDERLQVRERVKLRQYESCIRSLDYIYD